jgi:hypothetical protein
MASARLATGFLRCIQTDNKCDVTGRACHDKTQSSTANSKPYCSEHARRAFIAVTPLRMRVAA